MQILGGSLPESNDVEEKYPQIKIIKRREDKSYWETGILINQISAAVINQESRGVIKDYTF